MKERLYTKEEVLDMLQKQKEQTIFALCLSSRSFHYPSQFIEMKEWMMKCPLVLE